MIAGPAIAKPAAPAKPSVPARPAIVPQVLLNGVGPLAWNAAVGRQRGNGPDAPEWSALRVLDPFGTESLFVFPERAPAPVLVASWPKQEVAAHVARIFPGYRWVVIQTPTDSSARFYDMDGTLRWHTRTGSAPAALGRDLVIARRPPGADALPRLSVLSLPSGAPRASWPALAGWGACSPLENFLAVNTIGLVDSATGLRQDELRLLDLEGRILWARTLAADSREFAVSNFGDVAIAREKSLVVFDRTGAEKLRVALPRNTVGRTAITPDGRFALVAASSPVAERSGTGLWIALYETTRDTPVWSRRNLPVEGGREEVLELSISDDGQRALIRLATGTVFLLGSDGKRQASWSLSCISRGEYDPGWVPRRTWLSGDGALVAFTMPVAPSLAAARGWLFRVPR